jgi:hypothetical protein
MAEAEELDLRARCLSCAYPLRGLPEHRCPECGRAFDPRNRWTIWLPTQPHRLVRWLASRPSRAARAAPLIGVIAIAWGTSMPGWRDLSMWVGIILLCAACAGGIAWTTAVGRITRCGFYDRGLFDESRRRQQGVWRMVAIGVVLIVLRPSLYARFWISEPWLERAAAAIDAQPFSQAAPSIGEVRGLYVIGATRRYPHGVKLKTGFFPEASAWRDDVSQYPYDAGPGFFHRIHPGECERFELSWPLGGGWYVSK